MSILERYQDRANGYKLDSSCLWKLGLLRKTENAKLLLDYGTLHAFVKTPHSVTYKCRFYPYANSLQEELSDNYLASSSEMLGKNIFENFGFITAKYYPQKINGKIYLASPNFLEGICKYTTLRAFLCQKMGSQPEKYLSESSEDSLVQKLKSHIFARNNLTFTLENKERYLEIMTEECYDKYVSYMLLALFTFCNDEHPSNIIFCRDDDSKKFQDVFIFDKESTAFNYFLARKMEFRDIKFKMFNQEQEGSDIIVNYGSENYSDKLKGIKRLVLEGKIDKKYIDLINQYANLSLEGLRDKVYIEDGLYIKDEQLDCYKLGRDCAEELLQNC